MNIIVNEGIFPSLQSIITQVCATAVIGLFSYCFLKTPLLNFVIKREDMLQAKLISAQKTLDEAQAVREESKNQLNDSIKKSAELMLNAQRQADLLSEKIKEEADLKALNIKEKADIAINKKQEMLHQEFQREVVEGALLVSKKMLQEKDLFKQNSATINAFIEEINNEPNW